MSYAGMRDLTRFSALFLGKALFTWVLSFGAIVAFTLPAILAFDTPSVRGVAVLVLIGFSAYLSTHMVMSGVHQEVYDQLDSLQKAAAVFLSFGYYNLLVIVGVLLYTFLLPLVGPGLAALAAVLYPAYDLETTPWNNPLSIGGWINITMLVLETVIESVYRFRQLTLSEVPFIAFDQFRHPGLR